MKAVAACQALAIFTILTVALAPADPPRAESRIVATKYPTAETVVAGCTVREFGAKDDGSAEDTHAMQDAMDPLAKAGGGTVLVPEGHYAIKGNLRIPTGVTLRGEWEKPQPGKRIRGTILMAYAGRGNAKGAPFIELEMSSRVMDMTICYPEQNPDSIQPYPFTIHHLKGNNSMVKNVTLVNSYQPRNGICL